MLKRSVMEKGTHDWVEKSKDVGTRTAKQCRERWYQSLKPDLNRSRITKEEGDIIIDRATRKGQGWAEIARQLKGRSDNLVKNWYYGRKKRSESASKSTAAKQPRSANSKSPAAQRPRSSNSKSLAAQRPHPYSRESDELPSLLDDSQKQRQNQRIPGVEIFHEMERIGSQIHRGHEVAHSGESREK